MQDLIGQKNYAAAEQGLEVILQAHPTSAKAFYSMAQAQAGLGHLDKAQFALNKARGLDPTLKFASEDNVKALEQAITPQAAKIEAVETSHFWRNLFLFLVVCGSVVGFAYMWSLRKKPEDDKPYGGHVPPKPIPTPPEDSPSDKAYMAEHNLIDAVTEAPVPKKRGRPAKATPTPAPTAYTPAPRGTTSGYVPANEHYAPQPQPVIVNNNSGSDMLTGVMIGSMMSNNHHDHTTVIEREVIVERPTPRYTAPEPAYEAPRRSSSWNDDAPAKSSSWNDDTPSKSSSWGSSSSSDSSSDWSSSDSSSSSSDSGSSSSWD